MRQTSEKCRRSWTNYKLSHRGAQLPPLSLIISTYTKVVSLKNQTERMIDRIKNVEKFNDIAYLCEDFQSFVDEVQEWGVDHICGVDFFGKGFELNPELDFNLLDEFFSSFVYTKSTPHPAGRYA